MIGGQPSHPGQLRYTPDFGETYDHLSVDLPRVPVAGDYIDVIDTDGWAPKLATKKTISGPLGTTVHVILYVDKVTLNEASLLDQFTAEVKFT